MLNTVCHRQTERSKLGEIGVSDFDIVVKNPLSPVEHPGGAGVNCELFELGVEQFVVRSTEYILSCSNTDKCSCRLHLFRVDAWLSWL